MEKVSLPPKKSGSKRSKTLLLAAPAACLWTWTCEQRLLRAAQPPDSHENHRDSNPKSWPREPRNEHLVVWEKSCPVETSTSQTACGSEHHSFYMDAESRPLQIGEKGQIGWSLEMAAEPRFWLSQPCFVSQEKVSVEPHLSDQVDCILFCHPRRRPSAEE